MPGARVTDYRKQFFQECMSYVQDLAGRSVLVVGCGRGEDCQPFAQGGAAVCGLDISEEIGRNFAHPAVTYVRGSIEGCGLESEQFDLVSCIATMEHVHDIGPAFREMVRVTKPGGLIYSVAAPLWNSRQGHHIKCYLRFPWIHLRAGRADILRLALDNGLYHSNGRNIWAAIDLMYSRHFNRLPARRYLEACSCLEVSQTLRNDLWLEDAAHLTPEIFAELEPKGFTREELLAVSHSFIARR